ncbi:high-affinity iron transporter [Tumebacillus sp. BK434]|uniref:FTR1 family iron permease n=1 Tax=Tumebacillus sp. BK434 TaxID=2512169 RepID=UPI0010451913|nr:FTR1 family protein [Tumebacillus sp. BK434]TCP57944.1 high-affinity iron transporter [Tumebacillus sp. BK434]
MNLKSLLSTLLIGLLLFTATASYAATPQDNRLIALASDALVNAGGDDWDRTKADLAEMNTLWAEANDTSAAGQAVSAALTAAETAAGKTPFDRAAAYKAVSALAKAVDEYVSSHEAEQGGAKAQENVKALLPHLKRALSSTEAGDTAAAKAAYSSFISGWAKAEGPLRKENVGLYGKVETKISGARIALNTAPPDAEKAKASLQDVIRLLEDYVAGKVQTSDAAAGESRSVADLQQLLSGALTDVQDEKAAAAAAKLEEIIAAWPSVEGQVLTRSPEAYARIETKMTSVPSFLLSSPPDLKKAESMIRDLQTELEPYADAASYTAWDAGLILFREGLEAILVITALLAFLNRSGNADKRKWVWTGAGTGIVLSGVLAVVLSLVFNTATAGSSRELIEGYTGLIAVVFMLTVGAWLHSKSNLKLWNQFIEKTLGAVLARGALWSLAATAGLAVLREGAETIIFYLGMAPSISLSQLLIGIGGALAVLAVIAFAILKLSARIPVRPFFLVASLLLYYLAFKFIGVSVHALQVSGQLPSHLSDALLQAPSLGIYATWETTVPQLVVLVVVLWNVVRTERKNARLKQSVAA